MTAALHWLLPTPSSSRLTLRAVSAADGHDAAALARWFCDGSLVWVAGAVYLPLDVAGTAAARQEALDRLVPRGATVAMATAVWARGGPGMPSSAPTGVESSRARIELLVPGGSAPRPAFPEVRYRQSDVRPRDVERLGPLRVTTGPRTAVDLARWGDGPDDDAALTWLWTHGVTPATAAAVVRDQRRSPGVRRVRQVLAAVRSGCTDPLSTLGLDEPGQPVRLPVIR